MDVTEKKVITLSNQKKYYILDDLGAPEDEENTKYLFAIGITPEWNFDTNEIIFIKYYQEDGKDMVMIVDEDDPMYEKVSNLEAVRVRIENDPKFRNELENSLEKLEESSI